MNLFERKSTYAQEIADISLVLMNKPVTDRTREIQSLSHTNRRIDNGT